MILGASLDCLTDRTELLLVSTAKALPKLGLIDRCLLCVYLRTRCFCVYIAVFSWIFHCAGAPSCLCPLLWRIEVLQSDVFSFDPEPWATWLNRNPVDLIFPLLVCVWVAVGAFWLKEIVAFCHAGCGACRLVDCCALSFVDGKRHVVARLPLRQVDIAAQNAADHRLWFGWIESRMRSLLVCLDQIDVSTPLPPSVSLAPPLALPL